MIRALRYALLLALAGSAAGDDALEQLRAAALPLRTDEARHRELPGVWTRNSNGDRLRYAMPALAPVKRRLRDWLELELRTAPENVRERSFEARLNAALRKADLFCQATEGESAPDRCSFENQDWNSIGYVYPGIRVYRPVPGVLVVVAGIGIECGTDSSAYAYEWRDGKWQRFWQSEQAIDANWRPQGIDVVSVSEPDAHGARHVMTLGNMDWCSSSYYPVYVRLWRTQPGQAEPKLLLESEQPAWLAGGDDITPPITGRVTQTEARFEFMRNDRLALENHEAVVNYAIRGDTLTRIEPLARSPDGYVLEWLDAPWAESRRWIAASDAARFEPWHRKLKSGDVYTEYPTTKGCRGDPGSWQVTFDLASRKDESAGYTLYFGVSQVSPERFVIRDIRTESRADCDGPGFGATEVASD